MNSLAVSGNVIGEPSFRNSQSAKCTFDICADGGPEGPIYLACVCFATLATAAAQLKESDRIFASGKLVTSRYGQAMSFVVNAFELLKPAAERGELKNV